MIMITVEVITDEGSDNSKSDEDHDDDSAYECSCRTCLRESFGAARVNFNFFNIFLRKRKLPKCTVQYFLCLWGDQNDRKQKVQKAPQEIFPV
jgi:hypothetical protein